MKYRDSISSMVTWEVFRTFEQRHDVVIFMF